MEAADRTEKRKQIGEPKQETCQERRGRIKGQFGSVISGRQGVTCRELKRPCTVAIKITVPDTKLPAVNLTCA